MDVTKIIDILTSKNVEGCYQIYKETQWYDRDEMEQFQLKKLQKLVTHCYEHIPYYREYMLERNLTPASIVTLADIEKLPILTKEIIKENYDKFTPINIHQIKGVKVSQTGGTTGNILFKRTDADLRSSIWGTYKRFSDWMGVKPRDKKLILMGGHVIGKNYFDRLKKTVNNALTNSISFSPYDTSKENILKIIEALKNNEFKFIRSYPQFLFSIAQRLKSQGMSFDVKAITTTAEPLMPEHRVLFKEVFNAEIFDQYGCGEIMGVAYECPMHSGLHIADERVLVEVDDNNDLIITDLDSYAMPFIRYWNADQAIVSDEECSCGRKSRLIKKIMGRTCDYITGVNGEFLHWAYFWHLFFDSHVAEKRNLRKFQVVQKSKDKLLIRLVCDLLSKDEEGVLTKNMKDRLGDMNVVYSYEDDIENSASGKYRPVINEIL